MKRFFPASFLLMCALAVLFPSTFAQRNQDKAKPVAATTGPFGNVEAITAAQLKDYLYFVASDEMEGRDTPSRGLDLTAKFIAMNLSRWGVKPGGTDGTYLQKFALTSRRVLPEQTKAIVNGQNFKIGEDFIAAPFEGQASGQIVFVGHGYMIKAKNINPYQGIDVKDKILLVASGFPKGATPQLDFRGKIGVDFDSPATYAQAHGAKGIIVIPNSSTITFWEQRYKASLNPSRLTMERPQQTASLPIITASEKMSAAILQGEKLDYETIKKQVSDGALNESFELSAAKQASFNVAVKVEATMTQNVVGIIEGSDPVLKNEYVAVGAHYDHVGTRTTGEGDRIFNGADDDGSGTVGTLAIAEALANGSQRPKRSVIFVWHAGEEKGLWGSAYFADHPAVPINQIVAQLNIDMIGRSRKEGDTKPANKNLTGPNAIYVIGSKLMSTDLGKLSEEVNNSYLKLNFDYKYDAPDDPERFFYRSDHFNYAKKGIPIIFYFSGVHEDYHRPTDHADKIDYEKMEKVSRTIFATMWKLANAPTRPKVDKPLPSQLAN
ncbi:MAG: M20/M25/M40 family metallo-hydrolase [Blastocatellales bacterium]